MHFLLLGAYGQATMCLAVCPVLSYSEAHNLSTIKVGARQFMLQVDLASARKLISPLSELEIPPEIHLH